VRPQADDPNADSQWQPLQGGTESGNRSRSNVQRQSLTITVNHLR
jgi:hypothetical protein